nr:fluoride efflux transporter CrcB [Pseudomonas psychrotolerans]
MKLNGLFPNLPLGTLLVNLVGGFIIGMAMAFFTRFPNLDPAWKLLITTGFCGGLTTFSAFSTEVVFMLQQDRLGGRSGFRYDPCSRFAIYDLRWFL